MAKFWKIVKVICFSWGALTLALILFALLSNLFSSVFTSRHHNREAPAEHVVFEKNINNDKLVLKRKEAEGPDAYLLTLSRGNKVVVQNFQLPMKKYNLDYVSFYDVSIIPGRENEYRIVLFSASEGDGESDNQIWFLKKADTMSVREVITLSDAHFRDSDGLIIVGNKHLGLPYQEKFHHEAYIVPVMIRVRDNISISPLLTPSGADALQNMLQQEIKSRLEKPSQDKEEKLSERYQQASREMNEALSEKMLPY